jgi:hypothetical protein
MSGYFETALANASPEKCIEFVDVLTNAEAVDSIVSYLHAWIIPPDKHDPTPDEQEYDYLAKFSMRFLGAPRHIVAVLLRCSVAAWLRGSVSEIPHLSAFCPSNEGRPEGTPFKNWSPDTQREHENRGRGFRADPRRLAPDLLADASGADAFDVNAFGEPGGGDDDDEAGAAQAAGAPGGGAAAPKTNTRQPDWFYECGVCASPGCGKVFSKANKAKKAFVPKDGGEALKFCLQHGQSGVRAAKRAVKEAEAAAAAAAASAALDARLAAAAAAAAASAAAATTGAGVCAAGAGPSAPARATPRVIIGAGMVRASRACAGGGGGSGRRMAPLQWLPMMTPRPLAVVSPASHRSLCARGRSWTDST